MPLVVFSLEGSRLYKTSNIRNKKETFFGVLLLFIVNEINSYNNIMVPKAGLEPARALTPAGF